MFKKKNAKKPCSPKAAVQPKVNSSEERIIHTYSPHYDVTYSAAETELERLVRVANEGESAQVRLRQQYLGNVEVDVQFSGEKRTNRYEALQPGDGRLYFRIKSTPPPEPFAPFRVGLAVQMLKGVEPVWEVRADGTDHIKVGCKRFPVSVLRNALATMVKYGGEFTSQEFGEFKATRNAVELDTDEHLYEVSWADADKLLEACEAMLKAKEKR